MVTRRRKLELFGHVKRLDETENIREVAEMKLEKKYTSQKGSESLEHHAGMGH